MIEIPEEIKKKLGDLSKPRKMRWVSLHNHTTFSYGDGYGPVEQHVEWANFLGMSAISATEHGNNSSHAHLEKACKAHNMKAIFGCELYLAPTDEDNNWISIKTRKKFHQTVLAMNAEGYRNLNRIVSASWKDNFFQWPTTSSAMLRKWSEGLIVLSGCSDSLLSCTLLGGKEFGEKRFTCSPEQFEEAVQVVEMYQEVFGDRYYLEVQRFPQLKRTRKLNKLLYKLSKRTGAKLVATADVHYPFATDNEMQVVLHAAHRGSTADATEAGWEYDIPLTYPLSDQEIIDDIIATGIPPKAAKRAVLESEKIANRITVELPKNEPIKFPYPGSGLHGEERTYSRRISGQIFSSIEEYVWETLREGWDFRAERNPDLDERSEEYVARLKYEMEQITSKGYLDYFAFLSDAVRWAKSTEGIRPGTFKKKIPVGPARGSAAASLAAYLQKITEIDPMQFPHMLFERFIDPNRFDLPDVDLDFADDRREEMRQYLVYVYGEDRVGNIGNFTRYKGKNSIDDIAKVYRIPSWAAETVKELIVERSGGDARQSDSLQDTFDMFPKARKMLDQFPKLALATRLEGNYRGLGVHAAGIVISNTPISDTCAYYTREKSGGDMAQVVAYDKKGAEYVGMLKADFLGLKTMGMISIALDIIGMDLDDLYSVPITEKRVLRAFRKNDLTGIFQFEGRATAIVNADVYPTTFEHLADINALSRPGPLFSGMTAQYCAVKHGRMKQEKLHPIVDNLTGWTYGQIVYQEQVLAIVRDLAGFPMGRVGDIRRIISQKLGQMAMANAFEEFEQGCWKTNGIKADLARKIWDYIATSSTYSFNQSHSVSYALLAFWCMYLKVYHPTAFYAAQLTKVGDGKDNLYKRGKLMQDAIKHHIQIAPPDVNLSSERWEADEDSRRVFAGFQQVHGIGPATSTAILKWRDDRQYAAKLSGEEHLKLEWEDLIEVKGIGPKTIEKIREFAEKDDPFDIYYVGRVLGKYRTLVQTAPKIPNPTHHSTQMPKLGEHYVTWIGFARSKNFKDVIEATRTRTGKDVDEIMRTLKDPHLVKSCVIQAYDEGDEDVYLRFNRWAYPRFEEDIEEIKDNVDILVVRGKKREDFGISIHVTDMWVIDGSEDIGTTDDEEQDEEEL